ncbi:MAG TPA: glycosyltransferase [Thermoanaerobaculia bacterium]|nr:glycosyltransferase [Thermoanaerobaculia bacterium]
MSAQEVSGAVGPFIITFRRPGFLRTTLEAVLDQSRPPTSVFVIDNAASAETSEVVSECSSRGVTYLPGSENLGSSGGAVESIRACACAGRPWAWWIDDDDPPAVPDELERLLLLANSDPAIAAAGAFGLRWDWDRGRVVRVPNDELHGRVDLDMLSGNADI